jgi:hypothetical protein
MYISANAASNSAICSIRVGTTDYKSTELLSELLCSDLKFMRNFSKIHLYRFFRLSPRCDSNVDYSGNFPGVWVSIFKGMTVWSHCHTFEDGTNTGYRNVGSKNSDAGEIPRRIYIKIHLLFQSFESDTQKCIQTENTTASYASLLAIE